MALRSVPTARCFPRMASRSSHPTRLDESPNDDLYGEYEFGGGRSFERRDELGSDAFASSAFSSSAYSAAELGRGLDFGEPIHLGPNEELGSESIGASNAMDLRFRLERALEERDNALSALEHERSQRDQRVAALNEEQERFVARMLREHEEEMFLVSRESRRAKEDARRAQQDLGKSRREVGRLRGDLESVQAELNATRDELERLRMLIGDTPSRMDSGLRAPPRLREDAEAETEIERLLVEYSRDMEARPSSMGSETLLSQEPTRQKTTYRSTMQTTSQSYARPQEERKPLKKSRAR